MSMLLVAPTSFSDATASNHTLFTGTAGIGLVIDCIAIDVVSGIATAAGAATCFIVVTAGGTNVVSASFLQNSSGASVQAPGKSYIWTFPSGLVLTPNSNIVVASNSFANLSNILYNVAIYAQLYS